VTGAVATLAATIGGIGGIAGIGGIVAAPPLPAVAAAGPAPAEPARVWVVDSEGDMPDIRRGDGICASADGDCTLRAAIGEAKRHSGGADIRFAIPGPGPHLVELFSPLPPLDAPTTPIAIRGYTQPGAAPNTARWGSNAVIGIELRGVSDTAAGFPGLRITSPGNEVRGLSFTQMYRKIVLTGPGAHHNVIAGNFVGTDPSGAWGAPARTLYANGIQIEHGAARNEIGGPALADRNVVSGNPGHGIALYHVESDFNVIRNNLVGLTPDGRYRLANWVEGIDVNLGSSDNVIGGTGPYDANVVSGNGTGGIELSHDRLTVRNRVVGNFVGTTIDGTGANVQTRNFGAGIVVEDAASDNVVEGNVVGNSERVGIAVRAYVPGRQAVGNVIRDNWVGITPAGVPIGNMMEGIHLKSLVRETLIEGNRIAHNGGAAIDLDTRWEDADRNAFVSNLTWANDGLGIDIAPLGVANANDAADADSGPNDRLNHPVLRTVTAARVAGTACAGCTVQVFVADDARARNAEGRRLLGSVVADGSGAFSLPLDPGDATVGDGVVATARDGLGNTSELSPTATVGGG